jgi:signal transduction histidine kinase
VTLTNRLSGYFLAFLAAVLLAFSVSLYALASRHLHRRQDERAQAILDALVAAVEAEPDGLEWSRKQRALLSRADDGTPFWAVFDATGQAVDGSDPTHVESLRPFADEAQPHRTVSYGGSTWGVGRRVFVDPNPAAVERRAPPGKPREPGMERYRSLVFVAATPQTPMRESLRALAVALAVVSAGVWLLAAAGSRWVCRRAIAPVTDMADAAKRITADDLAARLPAPDRRDELRALADSFNALLGRLQESFERQRRFTGEASHQLRTPLTAILGQVEVALRRDRDGGEYRRVLTAVGGQAGRLHQIVELLLFLARADGEAAAPEARLTDLREWLPAHIDAAWGEHPRRRELRVAVPPDGPVWVLVQPLLLGQALDNLIDNALKYGPDHGPVEVGLAAGLQTATVRVADRGVGVPADEASRVFQPFFRSASARRSGVAGVGLGLAVTARIVAAFRGTVALRPDTDGGCVSEITLPSVPPPPVRVRSGVSPDDHYGPVQPG